MVVENAWAPSNGGRIHTDSAVVLENVAAGFKKPSILDVKLGARLWGNDAPQAKRDKLDKVAEETTSKALGLRIAGMRTYQGTSSNGVENVTPDGYRFYDKMYGRTFSAETVAQGFEEYFQLIRGEKAKGSLRKVIRRFVEDLRAIEAVMEKEESRMYSASLLFVYEGDQQALKDAFENEREIIASLERKARGDDDGDEATISKKVAMEDSDPAAGGSNDTIVANGVSIDHAANGKKETEDEQEHVVDEEEGVKFPAIQNLKLIDFAHAEWTPGQGPDENVLHGIRNTTSILMSLAG